MERGRALTTLAAGSAVLAFLALGVSACLQTRGQRRAELERRLEEVIPADADVRALGFGDCAELAPSPSCASASFELPIRDARRRAALVRTRATRNGWTVRHDENLEGVWSLGLKKGEFTAVVSLRRPEVYGARCGERSTSVEAQFCLDEVAVTRVG